jgi:hypothetical protein
MARCRRRREEMCCHRVHVLICQFYSEVTRFQIESLLPAVCKYKQYTTMESKKLLESYSFTNIARIHAIMVAGSACVELKK